MSNKIRLSETEFKKVINESVKTVIKEISNSQVKKRYINKIYNKVKNLTSHIYKDDNWTAPFEAFEIINNVIEHDGELNVWCENGGYWKGIGEFPNYKEFKFKIELNGGLEINGSLKCHTAGTIEDPFSRYDMTITMW